MEQVVYWSFGVLGTAALFLHFKSNSAKEGVPRNADLSALQRKFFAVYFPALLSDWLQGPYVYQVYKTYGFAEQDISLLYLIGFASSVLFGTCTGPLADKFGRKRMCIMYCVLYAICCVTKLSPDFRMLAFGRVCGGVATSLLFSSFESWYVYEHKLTARLSPDLISITFSASTFWNGILAIVAGLLANLFAESLSFGPVSPFIVALPFLAIAATLILTTWTENYGEKSESSWIMSCGEGFNKIHEDSNILLLGAFQSLFESVMYIFVFLWTPMLSAGAPPLGFVFAAYMVCVMLGSSVFRIGFSDGLSKSSDALQLAGVLLCVSTAVTSVIEGDYLFTFSTEIKYTAAFFMFLLLEISVGIYFPAISTLRSHVVPESHRAGIMNWFRVPMNIVTCFSLILAKKSNAHKVFAGCALLAVLCILAARSLHRRLFGKQYSPLPEAIEVKESA